MIRGVSKDGAHTLCTSPLSPSEGLLPSPRSAGQGGGQGPSSKDQERAESKVPRPAGHGVEGVDTESQVLLDHLGLPPPAHSLHARTLELQEEITQHGETLSSARDGPDRKSTRLGHPGSPLGTPWRPAWPPDCPL